MKPLIKFLQEARNELAKVSWPTFEQAIRLTIGVVLVSAAISLVIFGIDSLFGAGIKTLVTQVEVWKEKRTASPSTGGVTATPINVETSPVTTK
jgi:preprotein translocase subunit SecE